MTLLLSFALVQCMPDDVFSLDFDLACEVVRWCGLSGDFCPQQFLVAFGRTLAHGSLAKLEALANNTALLGADPSATAMIVTRGPATAVTCHAATTLGAAVINTLSDDTAEVVIAQRRDPAAVAVDFHSQVLLHCTTLERPLLFDPHFGTGGVELFDGARSVGSRQILLSDVVHDHTQSRGRWASIVTGLGLSQPMRYEVEIRWAGPQLVQSLVEVSRTHSGVPSVPYAVYVGATYVLLCREIEGRGVVIVTTNTESVEVARCATFAEAFLFTQHLHLWARSLGV